MILIYKPNRRNRVDWIIDQQLDTVIIITDINFVVRNGGYSQSYTYVKTSYYVVYNCYASGNRDNEGMERMVVETADKIRRNEEYATVVGDLIAK